MKKIVLVITLILALSSVFIACGKTDEKEIETLTRDTLVTDDEIVSSAETKNDENESDDEKQVEKEQESVSEEPVLKTENEPENAKQEDDTVSDEPIQKHDVTLDAIRSEIKTAVGAFDAMDLDISAISGLYGINPSDIKDAAGFVVMAGTFPHEVVMVDAIDEQAAVRIESLLGVKHASFVEQSKGYDADNYALAQKCRVQRLGSRVSMFLSPDYAVMNGIFAKYN